MTSEGGVLLVLETADGALSQVSLELLGAGRAVADALGGALSALLIGSGVTDLATDVGAYGADSVLVLDDAQLTDYVGDVYVQAVGQAVGRVSPRLVLVGQTESGRELAPRLAFRLH